MEKQFLDLYSETHRLITEKSAEIFNRDRDLAAQTAKEKPFPTRRTEEYLYCPLFEPLKTDWGVNINRMLFGLKAEQMFRCAVPGIKANAAYMVNDVWASDTPETDLGGGAFVCSMKHACTAHRAIVDKYYDTILQDREDGFVLLNRMLVQDGFLVYVPEGVNVAMPLQFVNMMRAGQALMANNRNLIIVENHGSLQIIDCDHSMDDFQYFASRITEIHVGESARLNYCVMESTHPQMANLRRYAVAAERNSDVKIGFFGLENGLTRNHVDVDLNGEGANVWLGGMLLADKEQQCDNFTVIRHRVPNCKSRELYKYILDDKAVGGFSGRIIVNHGAQKTESHQTNRNICLSPEARALGRPQLEIYADDVQCGHGATTGMLDEAAMFYMQQRGISRDEARRLLLQAFSSEVLEYIEQPALADRLHMLIEKRLRGEEMRCAGCRK